MTELPFHPKFQCYVRSLEYDFVAKRGRLIMGEISCTDMGGAIAVFEAIDSKVEIIETFNSGYVNTADTVYRKVDDKWAAFRAA